MLAAALLLAWRAGIGVEGALGQDATAWGLAAEGLWQGRSSPLPPAWPLLVAAGRGLGLALVPSGMAVSSLAAILIPGALLLSARAAGANRLGAGAAALLLLALPDWMGWATSMDSNSLVALGLVAATGLWARALARGLPPGPGLSLALVLLTGLLPLLRESTLPAVVAAMLLSLSFGRRGFGIALGILALWWLSPLLLLEAPGLSPLQTPWQDRGSTALADLRAGTGPLPNYVGEIPRESRGAYIESLRAGDLPALALFHARRSFDIARDGWLIALALLLTLAARLPGRPALRSALLPLLCLAPALLIWTQRRHVLLVVPAMLVLVALTSRPAGRRALTLLTMSALLAAALSWPSRWSTMAAEQRGEGRRAQALIELGAWICAQDPKLLGGPIQDVALYCPRPRHEPDGSVADWHTLLVIPRQAARGFEARGWVAVGPPAADLLVLQLHPEQERPCPEGEVSDETPFLQTRPVPAVLNRCPGAR